MSTRQLARSVQHGRLVTFRSPGLDPVTGYVAGMDDFHWFVLTPEGAEFLVHKSASVLEFGPRGSYAKEPNHDALERVIAPFRQHLRDANLIPLPRSTNQPASASAKEKATA